eukprot:CFRG0458T1
MRLQECAQIVGHEFKKAYENEKNDTRILIGIAGVPGSGKSTVAAVITDFLNKEVPQSAVVVPMDGFHYYRRELDLMKEDQENIHERRGAPWTFDVCAFLHALQTIKRCGEASLPAFEHSVGDPIPDKIKVTKRTRYVLIEGNYLLLDADIWRDIKSLCHKLYFMDVNVDDALKRLAERHMKVWGFTKKQALHRIEVNDGINSKLIQQSRSRADAFIQINFANEN